jgi:hypothetical protein
MELTEQIHQTTSILAATDLQYANRFIDYTGNYAGAGETSIGVLRYPIASGYQATIDCAGFIKVEAGGIFSIGDSLVSDASGKAVKATAITATASGGAATQAGSTATASGGTATVPAGAVAVKSSAESPACDMVQPTIAVTDGTIAVTNPSVAITGSATPQFIIGIACTAAGVDGDIIIVHIK